MKQHSRDQIFLTRERNNCRPSNRGYFAPYFEVLTGVIWVTIISCWRKTVYIAWINNFYIFKYYIIYMIELNTRKLYILWRSSYILSESISVCFGLLEFLFFFCDFSTYSSCSLCNTIGVVKTSPTVACICNCILGFSRWCRCNRGHNCLSKETNGCIRITFQAVGNFIIFWGDPYYPGGNRYKYRTNYSNNEKIVNYFEFYYPFALTFWYNC